MDVRLFFITLCLLSVKSELVTKKNCKDVNATLCSIHSVMVEPCPRGPRLCIVKPEKPYAINLDFTPHFDSNNLTLAMYSGDKKTNTFGNVIIPPREICSILSCPLQANKRSHLELNFMMDKTSPGKFPVQLKFWNVGDEEQVCCLTFNVKIRK